MGYNSTYKILNAKDFGIPQNRERIFTISIKKTENKFFDWDNIQSLECRPLKSFLHSFAETDVKLWFTNEKLTTAINKGYYKKNEWTLVPLEMEEYTNYWQLPRNLDGKAKHIDNANGSYNRYWKHDKVIGTLPASKVQNIIIPISLKSFDINKRIKIPHRNFSQTDTTVNELGITPTLLHNHGDVQKLACQLENDLTLDYCIQNNIAVFNIENKLYAIRHLSYVEYWRLMGWKDRDIKKVELSKSKMYFLPGNAIPIPILESILQELLN